MGVTLQDVVPAENGLIDLLIRARNKETGTFFTDKQIIAQVSLN